MLKSLIKIKKFLPIILTSSCITFFVPFIHEIPSNIAMATNLNPTNECKKIIIKYEKNDINIGHLDNRLNFKLAEIFLVEALNLDIMEKTKIESNEFAGNFGETGSYLDPRFWLEDLEMDGFLKCNLFLDNTTNMKKKNKENSTLKFIQDYFSNEDICESEDTSKNEYTLKSDFVEKLKKKAINNVTKENVVYFINFAIDMFKNKINNSNDEELINGIPKKDIVISHNNLDSFEHEFECGKILDCDNEEKCRNADFVGEIKYIIESIPINSVILK